MFLLLVRPAWMGLTSPQTVSTVSLDTTLIQGFAPYAHKLSLTVRPVVIVAPVLPVWRDSHFPQTVVPTAILAIIWTMAFVTNVGIP